MHGGMQRWMMSNASYKAKWQRADLPLNLIKGCLTENGRQRTIQIKFHLQLLGGNDFIFPYYPSKLGGQASSPLLFAKLGERRDLQ